MLRIRVAQWWCVARPVGRCSSSASPEAVQASGKRGPRGRALAVAGTVGLGACGCLALAASQSGDWDVATALALQLARLDAVLRPKLCAVLPHDVFVTLYSSSRSPFIAALASSASSSTASSSSPA